MFCIFNVFLALALLFFLFLPITDRKTVIMKLGMMAIIAVLFTVSVAGSYGPDLRVRTTQALLLNRN